MLDFLISFQHFFFQMHPLWYDTSRQLELDNLLLVVAQTGVFIYSAFCIIGSFFQLEEHLLAFLASLATLVQTTLQTAFILDASSRFACTNDQVIFSEFFFFSTLHFNFHKIYFLTFPACF